jgi:hypothetical protein
VKQAAGKQAFRIGSGGEKGSGMYVTLQADAVFEKGKGKFEVVILNQGKKKYINDITLKSDQLFDLSADEAKKLKADLDKKAKAAK